MILALVLANRMYQERVFRALDFPPMVADPLMLLLDDEYWLSWKCFHPDTALVRL